ncbi:hypothetical protein ACLBXM_07530 [Xanthobacteraceae bacterium A53D]
MSNLDQRQTATPALRIRFAAEQAQYIARLRSHPDFPAAGLQWTREIVNRYDGNRLLNRLLNDRERTIFALMALYLNATPDETGAGLTAGRIIALCEETRLCSRGRAKAMLVLMRWGGYVTAAPACAGNDRRQRPLVPTPAFIEAQIGRWRVIYEAAARVDPIGRQALERLDDATFHRTVLTHLISRFREGERLLDHAPSLSLFAARDGGILALLALTLAASEEDSFPPRQPVTVSVASLGRRFHVSRAHVLKLLRDAEAAGLLDRVADGRVQLRPELREGLENFFAAVFVSFLSGASTALASEPAAR